MRVLRVIYSTGSQSVVRAPQGVHGTSIGGPRNLANLEVNAADFGESHLATLVECSVAILADFQLDLAVLISCKKKNLLSSGIFGGFFFIKSSGFLVALTYY